MYSPFEVMFGRKPVLPVELDQRDDNEEQNLDAVEMEDATRILSDRRVCVLQEVKENIKKAQLKQKEAYDKKHCTPNGFQVYYDMIILVINTMIIGWCKCVKERFYKKKGKEEKWTSNGMARTT